jgi:hypothetical protein
MRTSRQGQYLLVLDAVSSLEPRVAEQLLRTLRIVHNYRSNKGMPVSLAVGLVPYNEPLHSLIEESSSWDIYHPEVQVTWFTRPQVSRLLSVVGGDRLCEQTSHIFKLFGGQPFLTSVAADMLTNGSVDPKEVLDAALSRKGQFVNHVKILRKTLFATIRSSQLTELFSTICNKEEGIPIKSLSAHHKALDFLLAVKLVDQCNGNVKAASYFYQCLGKSPGSLYGLAHE